MARAFGRGWHVGALLLLFSAFAPLAVPSAADAQCIDEAIRDELNARRRYRGVQERLFRKALRHELSVMGGGYAADLLSASYLVGGAYTFHFTESLGLEAGFGYTQAHSELVRTIEGTTGSTIVSLDHPVFIYTGHLVWSLAYGKMRWFGGTISRYDFYLSIGGGVTDNRTARGLTGSAGFGMKFLFGRWFAMRLDIRNHILQQELLGVSSIVNNLTATFGLSIFMPFRS